MNPAAKTAQINRAAEFRFLWTRRMEQSALCRALQQPVRLSLNTYVQSRRDEVTNTVQRLVVLP